MRKYLLIVFVLIFSIFPVACEKNDGSGHIFKYSIVGDPQNLDPQLSSDLSSINVVSNVFSGLFSENENGEIEKELVTDFEISSDGLIYTFLISDEYFWCFDGKKADNITAKDFLFTFQRLANKSTNSPHSQKYFCINNFEDVYNGLKDVSEIGVKIIDDYSFSITLNEPNIDFLTLLATPSAYPCNENFFYKTKGKYGLEAEFIPSSGPFFIKEWQYDPYGKNNYLILRKNIAYSDVETVYPYSINYLISKDFNACIDTFSKGSTDCIALNKNFKDIDLLYKMYETKTNGLLFNINSPLFENKAIQSSLFYAIDKELFKEDMPEGLSFADGIVPPAVSEEKNDKFNEIYQADTTLADELWHSNLSRKEEEKMLGQTIIASQDDDYAKYFSFISDSWSKYLGFYCPIEALPDDEYQKRLESGEYLIAIVQIHGNENSPLAYLENFTSFSDINFANYKNNDFDKLILNANKTNYNENETYKKAEKMLIEDIIYLPIFFESEYFFYKDNISDLSYNPFSQVVDFKNGKKY